jgi:hypothetical protein
MKTVPPDVPLAKFPAPCLSGAPWKTSYSLRRSLQPYALFPTPNTHFPLQTKCFPAHLF